MSVRTAEDSQATSDRPPRSDPHETVRRIQTAGRAHRWILSLAILFYLGMAYRMACVKSPWVDEGWIASAPANWARTGSMGTPSLEPTGSWLTNELTGINQYTYWNLPVAIFTQALWFKLFGLTILSMRSLSILCGLLGLFSWYVIVGKLTGSRLAGSLAAAFLAVDYTFLWSAADGRMDMMCASLGSAGTACYLALRENHWTLSLWLANTFLALAVFTHPNAMFPLITFLFLLLYYDRKRLSWGDLTALTPYLALAVLWGCYIVQRPDLFLAQFSANAAARGGSRWIGLLHPVTALRKEFIERYLLHFGFRPMWGQPVPAYSTAIPILYWLGLGAACLYAPIRRATGARTVVGLNILMLVSMALFEGLRAPAYLVFILPLYAGTLAMLIWKLHENKSTFAPASVIAAILLIGCQIGVERYKVITNPYGNEFHPTVEFVRQRAAKGVSIVADSCFGIELGFDRIRDDARVGFYSGLRPDLIVEDYWYHLWWHDQFPREEPELHLYLTHLLETEYDLVFERGPFRVYQRRGA